MDRLNHALETLQDIMDSAQSEIGDGEVWIIGVGKDNGKLYGFVEDCPLSEVRQTMDELRVITRRFWKSELEAKNALALFISAIGLLQDIR